MRPDAEQRASLLRLACLLGIGAVYLLSLRAYYVGFFNDDAFYVIGARSLLMGGYRELNALGEPPLVNYMPGYPLLLAQWAWVFGKSLLAAQLLSVVLSLASLAVLWRCFAPEAGPTVAFAAAAASGLSPLAVSLSGTVLADVPYLFLSLLLLLAARQCWEECGLGRWAALGAWAGFAVLVRPTGAALPLALTAALLWEGRRGPALAVAAAGGAVVAPFLVRNHLLTGQPLMYAVELADPLSGGGAGALALAAGNAFYYGRELFVRCLFRWPELPGSAALSVLTAVAGLAAVAAGLRHWGWRGWRKLLPLYLLLYAAAHLFWPKQAGRYLLPLLPLACAFLFLGLERWDRRRGWQGKGVLAVCALSLALSLGPVVNIVRTSLTLHTPVNTPPLRTLAWLRANTFPSDIFAAELDGRFYLLSDRQTVHLRKVYEPEAFQAWLREARADYVLAERTPFIMTTASGRSAHDPMALDRLRALLADARRYRRVFADAEEGCEIYQVR